MWYMFMLKLVREMGFLIVICLNVLFVVIFILIYIYNVKFGGFKYKLGFWVIYE